MTAIERALSRAVLTINDNDMLKQLVLLCAAGLFVAPADAELWRRSETAVLPGH